MLLSNREKVASFIWITTNDAMSPAISTKASKSVMHQSFATTAPTGPK